MFYQCDVLIHHLIFLARFSAKIILKLSEFILLATSFLVDIIENNVSHSWQKPDCK